MPLSINVNLPLWRTLAIFIMFGDESAPETWKRVEAIAKLFAAEEIEDFDAWNRSFTFEKLSFWEARLQQSVNTENFPEWVFRPLFQRDHEFPGLMDMALLISGFGIPIDYRNSSLKNRLRLWTPAVIEAMELVRAVRVGQ